MYAPTRSFCEKRISKKIHLRFQCRPANFLAQNLDGSQSLLTSEFPNYRDTSGEVLKRNISWKEGTPKHFKQRCQFFDFIVEMSDSYIWNTRLLRTHQKSTLTKHQFHPPGLNIDWLNKRESISNSRKLGGWDIWWTFGYTLGFAKTLYRLPHPKTKKGKSQSQIM